MRLRPHVLFVAGDGASGRIACEAYDRLVADGKISATCLIQPDHGAAGLFSSEKREHELVGVAALSVLEKHVTDSDLVVVMHSGTAWHLECLANVLAFKRDVPVIRVADSALGARHAYLRDIVAEWRIGGGRRFQVTAVNGIHERLLHGLYPELREGATVLLGSPLHFRLEELMANAPRDDASAAFFLSGNTPTQFTEILAMAAVAVPALAGHGVKRILVDVHFENRTELGAAEALFERWSRVLDLQIVWGVKPDEMLVASGVVFAAPSSTTCERGLICDRSVIQAGTVSVAKELAVKTGRAFPYTPEIESGSVLWADEHTNWPELAASAFDPHQQAKRRSAAGVAGLLPPRGALQRLVNVVRDRVIPA
jgi:hypothetical protein